MELAAIELEIEDIADWIKTDPGDTFASNLLTVETGCCICGDSAAKKIASGEDFEYRTSRDVFNMDQCRDCGLVYLNPRPHEYEFERIYPDNYHAFEFSEEKFGLVYRIRKRLEARRLLTWCEGLTSNARILDVGCGDGFHLELLAEYGDKSWHLEGIDIDERAVAIGREKGIGIHEGTLESVDLPEASFDLVFTVQTIEHVADPRELLVGIRRLLKPGGRLVVVTDNTGSPDFRLFRNRHWGGYHFPRHWNLFNKNNIEKLAKIADFEIERTATQISPVNWTYSVRNYLVDKKAPKWLYERFGLRSAAALSFFTAFDSIFRFFGNGALLNVFLRRPAETLVGKTEKSTIDPVVIVGGGLAGLTAARYLKENGVPFRLFESGEKLAGLAQSFHDEDGFTYDFGAHFVTNRLASEIGVLDKCREVPRYGESVWLDGRSYSYPFGLMRVPKYVASAIGSKVKGLAGRKGAKTAADFFSSSYGSRLAEEIAVPLTEAWSGASGDRLASSVGDSIPGSIFRTLYLKIASRVTGRAVACGYSREKKETASVWHVYPDGGVGVLCQKLAEDIGDSISLNSPVQKIIVENDKAVGVEVGGEHIAASAVVSTAPAHILPKIISGSDKLEYLSEFKFRPMTFVNMRFEGRGLLPDIVVWAPEKKFPFFRLTETAVSMPWLAPEGKTVITADIGCEKGDEIWEMDDEAIGEKCLESILELIPDARERYLGCRVLRTPLAYPVFLREYEENRKRFEQGLEIEGLYTIGRNGEFRHVFMEDAYWRAQRKMKELLAELGVN